MPSVHSSCRRPREPAGRRPKVRPGGRLRSSPPGVLNRLLHAQSLLPAGLRLLFIEGYRPPDLQRRYFEEYADELRTTNQAWTQDRVHEAASRYWLSVSGRPGWPRARSALRWGLARQSTDGARTGDGGQSLPVVSAGDLWCRGRPAGDRPGSGSGRFPPASSGGPSGRGRHGSSSETGTGGTSCRSRGERGVLAVVGEGPLGRGERCDDFVPASAAAQVAAGAVRDRDIEHSCVHGLGEGLGEDRAQGV